MSAETIQDSGILATRTGLRIPADLPFDGWRRAGTRLARFVDSACWYLGDWLVYGQDHFPARYQQATAAVGLDYQTLRNYAWIARRFTHSRRRLGLSFQHHAEVAAMMDAEQDMWLDRAERSTWSRNELRRQIRGGAGVAVGGDATVSLPKVRVANAERWRAAAERSSTSLTQWMVRTLDNAANHVLGPG